MFSNDMTKRMSIGMAKVKKALEEGGGGAARTARSTTPATTPAWLVPWCRPA